MDPVLRLRWRRAWTGLAAALLLAVGPPSAHAQTGGPPPVADTPISIHAEQITTWSDRNEQIFFLAGNVRIQQGTTVLTLARGVLWVNDQTRGITGAYFLDAYGEDGVSIAKDGQKNDGPRGLFAFTTRGRVDLKAASGQMPKLNLSSDPLFGRAVEARGRIGEVRSAAAQPAAAPTPPTLGIQQVQAIALAPDAGAPANVPPPTMQAVPAPPTPPAPPPFFGPPAPTTPVPPPPPDPGKPATPRTITIRPRTAEDIKVRSETTPSGENVYVVPSPVIVMVSNPKDKMGVLDIEADRMVFWTQGDGKKLFDNMRTPQGETTQHIEFYLAGNVVLRSESKTESEVIRADEVYYDVSRNAAIALRSDLEIKQPKLPQPIHVKAPELYQLNSKLYTAKDAEVYSTVLPSDPGLKVKVKDMVVEEREIRRESIFGFPILDPKTGEQKVVKQRYFTGTNYFVILEGVPVFYFPYYAGDAQDPLGPLQNFSVGGDRIFGFRLLTSWDAYQLLGLDRAPGTRWRLFVDYFSNRGPAAGSEFDFNGKDYFGTTNTTSGMLKAYGIYDGSDHDVLGGGRGQYDFYPPHSQVPITHRPDWRGRIFSQINVQDLPNGFVFQGQFSEISDRNYLEQYHHNEFLNGLNQETFAYLKQQQDQWAWSIIAQPRLRQWVTETELLPAANGWLLGQKLGDYFTWNVHGNAEFARLRPTDTPGFAYLPTDVRTDTGRFDLRSDLSLPFYAGPFKVVPYIVGDGALYTADVNGDTLGRLYGGGGVRASLPMSRLYGDVRSEFFNVDSLYHKMMFSTNYLYVESSARYNRFPQLDRLNDDVSDQALRDIRYRQIFINPSNANFLTTSPLFDPQVYAIRRLVDSRLDTIDRIDVAQFSWAQRLQTKRGLAASEHVVDWMSLNLGVSLFPQANRDNFGATWGIFEYDWVWNIGDRTALFSNGWFEPDINNGPSAYNFGGMIGRSDSTNLTLNYRRIELLNSQAVIGSLTYAFGPKYALTASTLWDFGIHQQNYGLTLTRLGTDLAMSLGITYNSVLQNFGIQFEIVPNLVRQSRPGGNLNATGGMGMSNSSGMGLSR